ncbi:zinc-binding dehydrogenase [Pseudonocardia sp. GCM10023141]|uniref:zinc-binding dehydrogenase n=1 Tax=Pseudonocardia sp. GCM10023141 TaxID=3252653 RepID=UPI003608DEA3
MAIEKMHAIRQHEFGDADVLRYERVDAPVPDAGQVLIRVAAAGVHLIDTTIRAGTGGGPMPVPDLPMTPGREVAGTIDAVGTGVEESWIGRTVVGHLGAANGGYAEYVVAELARIHPVLDGLDPAVAVAVIGTGRTTAAIVDAARITPSDVVLITAAAGGIGLLLVQWAKHAGATVVGVAGGETKLAAVRAAGADVAIDYLDPDWPAAVTTALGGRAVSAVLDGVGGAAGRAAFDLLGTEGRLLVFGWSAGAPVDVRTIDLFGRSLTVSGAIGARVLARLAEFEIMALRAAADGIAVPVVGQRFALSDAPDAHRAVAGRGTIGKTVLVPAGSDR